MAKEKVTENVLEGILGIFIIVLGMVHFTYLLGQLEVVIAASIPFENLLSYLFSFEVAQAVSIITLITSVVVFSYKLKNKKFDFISISALVFILILHVFALVQGSFRAIIGLSFLVFGVMAILQAFDYIPVEKKAEIKL